MSLEHISRIHENGLSALQKREIHPYPGHGEILRQFFGCAMLFTPQSLALLQERVLDPISTTAEKLGLGVLVYNTRMNHSSPVHSTLHVGKWTDEEDGREVAFTELASNLSFFENDVQGRNIVYDFVALDKANVFIACKEIPSIVSLLRSHLVDICGVVGVSGTPLPLLHSVVSRITDLPEEEAKKRASLRAYVEAMLVVKTAIEEKPLVLEVSGLWAGEVYQFLTTGTS